jgi:hypothetical protein
VLYQQDAGRNPAEIQPLVLDAIALGSLHKRLPRGHFAKLQHLRWQVVTWHISIYLDGDIITVMN